MHDILSDLLPGDLRLRRPDLLVPFLVGIATVLVLGVVFARRRRGGALTLLGLAFRGAMLGILALYLLAPARPLEERRPGTLLAAVDLSRSVGDAVREASVEVLRQWSSEGVTVAAVGFARTPVPLDLATGVPDIDPDDALVSSPETALAALLLGPRASGDAVRLVMLTDGALSLPPDALPPVPGEPPLVIAVGVRDGPALSATGLEVVEVPPPGRPVRLVWRGICTRAVAGEMVVFVDGEEVRRALVELSPGEVAVPFAVPSLDPGYHTVAARLSVAGDDPLDDGAAAEVRVVGRPKISVVSPAERPVVARALVAQDLDVTIVPSATFCADPSGTQPDVIVLDRVAASALSDAGVLRWLRTQVEAGGGLLYLPREDRGEIFDAAAKPFLELLPVVGQEPPPERRKEDEAPPDADSEGLAPPEADRRTKEKRLAPTLGLLLVIDASASMREGIRLRLAKEAAIAAAETLHPEDLVGVVQFNWTPYPILEMTKAGDRVLIADRIARIQADGGTEFGPALEFAKEVLERTNVAIKHVIFLSDGQSRPYRLKPLVTEMAAKGITVSTVGCGQDFDEGTLSDIAYWGKGKFHPAFNAEEIPQIFTVEAERVIAASGARSRRDAEPKDDKPAEPDPTLPPSKPTPEPEEKTKPVPIKAGLPAPYLQGIRTHDVPGIVGFHAAQPRSFGWVSLVTADQLMPVLVHGRVGDGRVAAFTLPLEGTWAEYLPNWDDYQVLLAQLVRFLLPDAERVRYHARAEGRGRVVDVRVIDREGRMPDAGLTLAVTDESGRRPAVAIERLSPDRWRARVDPRDPAAALRIEVAASGGKAVAGGSGFAFVSIPPPPEVRDAGVSLPGLTAWAAALGGTVASVPPEELDVPEERIQREESVDLLLLPWLLGIFVVDLVLRRLVPGRSR